MTITSSTPPLHHSARPDSRTCLRQRVLYFSGVDIAANFDAVRARIAKACQRAGRDPAAVELVAVSKGHPPEAIEAAAETGHVLFGESRVQEAKAKIPLCSSRLRWHLIGHLQTNKCRDAVQLFQMIESVDSFKLAEEINKWADKIGKRVPLLLETNIAGEATKFGLKPDQLIAELTQINALPRIEVHGLMTIAPWTPEPEKVRPIFRQLRELKQKCEAVLGAPLPHLSMGMSGDFEVAVEEGATIVRIGTALFGPRSTKARQETPETK